MPRKIDCRTVLFTITATAAATLASPAHAQTRRDLGPALTQLAIERDVQIIFQTRLVEGRMAGRVRRGAGLDETLAALVGGQGLVVRKLGPALYSLETVPARTALPSSGPGDDEVAPLEAVVVTASYAASLGRALALKRRAAYGLDAVSAEDIARLPAVNAAEALQLAPGVSLERHRGIGLYVSVRGLGPQFQNVLLNGRSVAMNDLVENGGFRGRQFRFEMLPADAIETIEVAKTTTADMDEGPLGGNIDVRTFKPLEQSRRAAVSVRGSVGQSGKVDPAASGVWSWTNESGSLGLLATGVADRRHIRNDRLYQTGWNLDRFPAVLGPGLYTPTRTRPTIELEDRRLASGDFALQWRPSAAWRTDLDLLLTRLDARYDEFGLDIYPDDSTLSAPRFVPGTQVVVGHMVQAGTIDNVRWMASRETSLNRHDLVALGAHQHWSQGSWSLEADYAYSRARSYHPDGRGTVRARAAFFAPLSFDFGRGREAGPTLTTPVDYADPNRFVGQAFDYTWKDSRDTDEALKLDASRVFDAPLVKLSAGVEQRRRVRDYRRRDWILDTVVGAPLTALGDRFHALTPVSDFLAGTTGDLPRHWVAPDARAFYERLFTAEIAARPPSISDLRNSFVVEEKIRSAYVRADFSGLWFGRAVDGDLGVRYARTDQVSQGVLSSGADPIPAQWRKTYGDWLPSANLRVTLRPDLLLRLGASRVVNRPNVVDNAPRITLARDTPTANGGNPDLDPFLATQLDVSLEWYLTSGGALTGAVFDRRLDNYITAQNTFIQVPGRGEVLLSTNVNGGDARIQGVEAAYSQTFRSLPAPLDGLGVQGSLTLVRSQASYFAGDRVIRNALLGLSRTNYSLLVFYERGRASVRLGYVWRGPYLTTIGSSITAPSHTEAFGSLDGAASWRIDRRMTLSLEGVNLTDARKYIYGETRDQPMETHHWGRYLSARLRWAF
ncbi:TonB-dependent receptor [Caulobacter rhizosphaerae]|jgi:TonB-dependent receptor|uniref:TonB-dependent receptor n=1 Tax=Caulobacter rhizosphaerae TaxID=2010972 RepID=UPI0013D815AB|nr:TonB-dependent receptor [Caulobacter rhizosphaerae]